MGTELAPAAAPGKLLVCLPPFHVLGELWGGHPFLHRGETGTVTSLPSQAHCLVGVRVVSVKNQSPTGRRYASPVLRKPKKHKHDATHNIVMMWLDLKQLIPE